MSDIHTAAGQAKRDQIYLLYSKLRILLSVPTSNQAFGDRAFSACAPQLWNKLRQAINASDNVDMFKTQLRTQLFIEAFG